MRPHPLARALSVALLWALSVSHALSADGASGTVTIDGESWPVADAVAVSDDGDVELWFTRLRFDRQAWAEDGAFGTFDTYEFVDDADGPALRIDVDEESGGYGGHTVRFSSSSSSGGYSSDLDGSLTLTTRSAERLAGSVKFDDGNGLAADIRFDLPVTAFGPLARAGTPLPDDGGEPGKVLRAMIEATHAGDLDRMAALSHPDRRQGIEQARASGEADQMLEMARVFTPKLRKITGGTVEGDQAWVEFIGDEDGREVKGTGELTRVDGAWVLTRINTRHGG